MYINCFLEKFSLFESEFTIVECYMEFNIVDINAYMRGSP